MTLTVRLTTLGLSIVLALTSDASAATISIYSGRDTTIFGNAVNNSNGSGVQMITGNAATSQPRRGLIRFDVAGSVPSGATITSATLTMSLVTSATGGPASTNVLLNRLLADWGEAGSVNGTGTGSGSGVAALSGDATWNMRIFNTTAWTTPGGDFFPTPSATLSVNKTNGAKTWLSTLLTVSDVQLWLDSPAQNFGWLVGPAPTDVTIQTERRFGTREETTTSLRPVLTVEFTEAVPEPATWMLAALAAGLLAVGACYRRALRAA